MFLRNTVWSRILLPLWGVYRDSVQQPLSHARFQLSGLVSAQVTCAALSGALIRCSFSNKWVFLLVNVHFAFLPEQGYHTTENQERQLHIDEHFINSLYIVVPVTLCGEHNFFL